MKNKTKFLYFILGLSIILNACKKSEEPIFIYEYSDEIVKYKVDFLDTKVIDYSKYINDELVETTVFNDYDSIIERITRNTENQIIHKITFTMGKEAVAISSQDSSFTTSGLWVTKSTYKYENGFLIEWNYDYWDYQGVGVDSGNVVITNTIDNENISSQKIVPNDWASGCTDYFAYNWHLNKLDISYFLNDIKGKNTKNLIESISLRNGCPTGTSSSIANKYYEYEFDYEGYVTKVYEYYTPSYNTVEPGEVIRTINTTIYEYPE